MSVPTSRYITVVDKLSKWDERFLGLARHWSQYSKDPGMKAGAVIVDWHRRVVSMGFNGLPQAIYDNPETLENRVEKLRLIIHADENAILFARDPLKDCKLYTFPLMPCAHCMSLAIQCYIRSVVAPWVDVDTHHWGEDLKLSMRIAEEAGVSLTLLRHTSLKGGQDE